MNLFQSCSTFLRGVWGKTALTSSMPPGFSVGHTASSSDHSREEDDDSEGAAGGGGGCKSATLAVSAASADVCGGGGGVAGTIRLLPSSSM